MEGGIQLWNRKAGHQEKTPEAIYNIWRRNPRAAGHTESSGIRRRERWKGGELPQKHTDKRGRTCLLWRVGLGRGLDLRLCLVCCVVRSYEATEGNLPPLLLLHPHQGVPGQSARPGRHDHAAPSPRGDAVRWCCPALCVRLRSQLVWRD